MATMWDLIKKGLCLSCIVFSNDPTSRGAVQSALKSLNTYGIPVANLSNIPNITAIEIPGIANVSNVYNITSNCTSTLTLDPVSFLAELETATAALELETAFPIAPVPLTATSVLGGNPALESLRGVLPNGAANNVIVVYPTPTESAKTSSSDAVSSRAVAKGSSTTTMGTSSAVTEASNHAHSSSTLALNPSNTFLDPSTTSSPPEPTATYSEPTKSSLELIADVSNHKSATPHTSLVTSSDLAKTASLFEPTSTSAEPTKTNREVLAGMSSGRLETTHSSPSMLLESPVSVPNHSAAKSFSKPTRTSTGLDSHTVSGDQTSQDTFSSIVPSPSGSLNATTPANYISSDQSATITSISPSTASLGSSISAADYSTTGAYTFPKLHDSNGLAAASGNFSGIARPNSSFSEQNMSTTGAHVKPTIDLSNIYSTASNISGTATLNSSAVHHSIALPIIDSKYNSSSTGNDSSGIPSPNSWIPAAMFFELQRKKESAIVNDSTQNHCGFMTLNASQPIGQNQTEDAITLIDFTNQLCEGNTALNKRGLCNLPVDNLNQGNFTFGNFTSGNFMEPMFTFEELKNMTAQFDYVGYWDKINDLEEFQDEPEISNLEYFEMTQENVKRSWHMSGITSGL